METKIKAVPACTQAQQQMPEKHQYVNGICNICGCPKDEGGGGSSPVCHCFRGYFYCTHCGNYHAVPGVERHE